MFGLIETAGRYRSEGVGVMSGEQVVHMAPQADRVPQLMNALIEWLKTTDTHPLISSCVFHYELEFIHPFVDGNGRIGRLWQTLILSQWQAVFLYLPVESIIHQNQDAYYQAIRQSTAKTDSYPFIEFILMMILKAVDDGVNDGVKLNIKEQELIKILKNQPEITLDKIVTLTQLSKSTIERRIRKLKQQNIIKRIGSDKTGYWKVIQ